MFKHCEPLKKRNIWKKTNRMDVNTQTQSTPSFDMFVNQLSQPQRNVPLHERLKLTHDQQFQPMPIDMFRKYISYGRKYCFPALNKEAADELKKVYLEMRVAVANTVPVTTRQLEGLIRLTQARARIELANVATIQHARDVIEIVRGTLHYGLNDGADKLPQNPVKQPKAKNLASQCREMVEAIKKLNQKLIHTTRLKLIYEQDVQPVQNIFDKVLKQLNVVGHLLMKPGGFYEFHA